MIKNILVYTIIPCLVVASIVLMWANNKIRMIKNNYETKLEVPLEDLTALHKTITSLYQLSLSLNNPDNKQTFLSKSIELYQLNDKLVQNYLKLAKEEKTSKIISKFRANIQRNAANAQEVMEKLKSLKKKE